MITKYQKEQTVTRLKKAYSLLAQTIPTAISNNGPIENWDYEDANDGGSVEFGDKFLIPYLNTMKNCKDTTTNDCEFKFTYLNSNNEETLDSFWSRFFLADGTFIALKARNYIANERPFKYAHLFVDINGQKKPNKLGKDIFNFKYYIVETYSTIKFIGIFKPQGFSSTRNTLINQSESGCSISANGRYCAALIMNDGWQIKDDYPW